jgi:putative peptidoglycan lipid II flippase
LRKVVRLITPMILGLSAGRINILVNTLLASFLMEGSISYLNYSYRLMHFPLGVFAVALGTVALPRVSELAARRDLDGMCHAFTEAIGLNMLVVVPSAAFLALLGRETVDLIYQWGAFSGLDASRTALALLHYSYGLIGFAAVRVTVPFFYAFGDSRLPMKVSVISVVVNMALYYPLIAVLDFAGLAAATSIAGIVNFVLLARYLPTKGLAVAWGHLGSAFVRIAVASVLAFYCAKMLPVSFAGTMPEVPARALELLVPAAAAGVIYLGLCFVMRVRELDLLVRAFRRRRQSD